MVKETFFVTKNVIMNRRKWVYLTISLIIEEQDIKLNNVHRERLSHLFFRKQT